MFCWWPPGCQRGTGRVYTPAADAHSRGSRRLVRGSRAELVGMVNPLPDISSQGASMTAPILPPPTPETSLMFWNRVSSCRNHLTYCSLVQRVALENTPSLSLKYDSRLRSPVIPRAKESVKVSRSWGEGQRCCPREMTGAHYKAHLGTAWRVQPALLAPTLQSSAWLH